MSIEKIITDHTAALLVVAAAYDRNTNALVQMHGAASSGKDAPKSTTEKIAEATGKTKTPVKNKSKAANKKPPAKPKDEEPEVEADAEGDDESDEVTLQMLKDALSAIGDGEVIAQLVSDAGAPRLSELPEDAWPGLYAAAVNHTSE